MLRSLNKILGSSIVATDGEIGSVYNFLFDDVSWRVVYIVVMAGASFSKHKVLLSPSAIKQPDWNYKVLPVSLTSEQVKSSPEIDTDQPVSRQQEIALHQHYSWPPYWETPAETRESFLTPESHLRSCQELVGYSVTVGGEGLGEVEDFMLDDRSWTIRYIVARAGAESGGHILMFPTESAREISWVDRRVEMN